MAALLNFFGREGGRKGTADIFLFLCICLCHPRVNPHKASIILTSASGDSCEDLTQKTCDLTNTCGGGREGRLGERDLEDYSAAISLAQGPSEIQEVPGTSHRAQEAKAAPPTHRKDQSNLQPPTPLSHS